MLDSIGNNKLRSLLATILVGIVFQRSYAQAPRTIIRVTFPSPTQSDARELTHPGVGFMGFLSGSPRVEDDTSGAYRIPAWLLEGGPIPQVDALDASVWTPQGPLNQGFPKQENKGLELSIWNWSSETDVDDDRDGEIDRKMIEGYHRVDSMSAQWHYGLYDRFPKKENHQYQEPWSYFWDESSQAFSSVWDAVEKSYKANRGPGDFFPDHPALTDPRHSEYLQLQHFGSYAYWFEYVQDRARLILNDGANPRWMVWNEPNGFGHIMKAGILPNAQFAHQAYFDNPYRNMAYTYHVAYLALRSVYSDFIDSNGDGDDDYLLDDLVIGGPQTSNPITAFHWLTGREYLLDQRGHGDYPPILSSTGKPLWEGGFYEYAKRHKLPLDFIVYHIFMDHFMHIVPAVLEDLANTRSWDVDGDGRTVADELGIQGISVNEMFIHGNSRYPQGRDGGYFEFHLNPGHTVVLLSALERGQVTDAARSCWGMRDIFSSEKTDGSFDPLYLESQQGWLSWHDSCDDYSLNELLYVEYTSQSQGAPLLRYPVRYYRRPVYWVYYAYSRMSGRIASTEIHDEFGEDYPVQSALGAANYQPDDLSKSEYSVLLGYSNSLSVDLDLETGGKVEHHTLGDTQTNLHLENLPVLGGSLRMQAELSILEIPPPLEDKPWAPSENQVFLASDYFDGRDNRPLGVPHNQLEYLVERRTIEYDESGTFVFRFDEESELFKRSHAYYLTLSDFRSLDDAVDTVPPIVTVTAPAQDEIFPYFGGLLRGVVADEGSGVERIEVFVYDAARANPVTAFSPAIDLNPQTHEWTFQVRPEHLTPGATAALVVRAIDRAGNASDWSKTFVYVLPYDVGLPRITPGRPFAPQVTDFD